MRAPLVRVEMLIREALREMPNPCEGCEIAGRHRVCPVLSGVPGYSCPAREAYERARRRLVEALRLIRRARRRGGVREAPPLSELPRRERA